MKKQKTAAIGNDIVDAVFANTINDAEISNEDNSETRAQVVEKDDDDDDDIDIFTRDFSSELK